MLFSVNHVSHGNILIVLEKYVDRPSEGLYAMLFELQCNTLWAVCSIC